MIQKILRFLGGLLYVAVLIGVGWGLVVLLAYLAGLALGVDIFGGAR